MPQKAKKEKVFRISAKRLFLTYPQVPEELVSEDVLAQLQGAVGFDDYIIATERHEDGGKHIHVLLSSKTKYNIQNPDKLDVVFDGKQYHGNYQSVRQYKNVAEYVAKHGDYKSNITNFRNGRFTSMEEDLIDSVHSDGVDAAFDKLVREYPKRALRGLNAATAARILEAISLGKSGDQKVDLPDMPFTLANFDRSESLNDWISQGFQPTLLLVGPGGSGKTAFCQTLAQDQKWKMLTINHVDGIRHLTKEHNALLVDDPSLMGIDDQQLLALIGTDQDRQIRVLHKTVHKPKGLVQMITINPNVLSNIKKRLSQTQFLRRLKIINVDKNFLINVNINVEINTHTHIYNNEQNISDNKKLLDEI